MKNVGPRATIRNASSPGFTVMELAVAVAVLGSTLAVAIPTFVRDMKSSRFVEPTLGLTAIAEGAVAYAGGHGTQATLILAFPRSVGLTPSTPPRGRLAADPPGTWSDPTWQALHFPTTTSGFAFADDDPHAFSFAFESALANARSSFIARACGDLDGDGARSTFEVRGHDTQSEGAVIEPGMYVEAPLE